PPVLAEAMPAPGAGRAAEPLPEPPVLAEAVPAPGAGRAAEPRAAEGEPERFPAPPDPGGVFELGPPKTASRTEERRVVIEDLPDKPYSREIEAVAASPEPRQAEQEESWVVLEKKSDPPPLEPVEALPVEPAAPDAREPRASAEAEADGSPAEASEIVEDMLTLMRPRPSGESLVEQQRGELHEEPHDATGLARMAAHGGQTEDAFFASGELHIADADDLEMPGRSRAWIWLVSTFVAMGLGAGGYWYYYHYLGQSGEGGGGVAPVYADGAAGRAERDAGPPPAAPTDAGSIALADAGLVAGAAIDAGPGDAQPERVASATDGGLAPEEDVPVVPIPTGDRGEKVASEDFLKHLEEGKRHLDKYRFAKAAISLQKAVDLDPDSEDAQVALANAHFELGRFNKSLEHAWKALKVNPDNARAHLTLGTIYQTLDKRKQAVQHYKKFLKLQPTGRMANEVRTILKGLK
ncbi:MAG: tetratricopeptide repeat protein, partial [Deltaproteobacteria bacterium]|nr:tetratricopeptide repeat protein [Deltaproteobacteria bacterium]